MRKQCLYPVNWVNVHFQEAVKLINRYFIIIQKVMLVDYDAQLLISYIFYLSRNLSFVAEESHGMWLKYLIEVSIVDVPIGMQFNV